MAILSGPGNKLTASAISLCVGVVTPPPRGPGGSRQIQAEWRFGSSRTARGWHGPSGTSDPGPLKFSSRRRTTRRSTTRPVGCHFRRDGGPTTGCSPQSRQAGRPLPTRSFSSSSRARRQRAGADRRQANSSGCRRWRSDRSPPRIATFPCERLSSAPSCIPPGARGPYRSPSRSRADRRCCGSCRPAGRWTSPAGPTTGRTFQTSCWLSCCGMCREPGPHQDRTRPGGAGTIRDRSRGPVHTDAATGATLSRWPNDAGPCAVPRS
jgi:hypothetical protein